MHVIIRLYFPQPVHLYRIVIFNYLLRVYIRRTERRDNILKLGGSSRFCVRATTNDALGLVFGFFSYFYYFTYYTIHRYVFIHICGTQPPPTTRGRRHAGIPWRLRFPQTRFSRIMDIIIITIEITNFRRCVIPAVAATT